MVFSYIKLFSFLCSAQIECFYYIYIETHPFSLFPYIVCFYIQENITFLISSFFLLYLAQIVVYVSLIYIWKLDIFPEKYVFYYIQKKDAFFLCILSRYILYMCIFPIYIGVFILYINHFFFFSFPPAHSISVYRENNAFIYSTVQIMVFSLYIQGNIALSFLIYLATVFPIGGFLYISILEIWYFPIYIDNKHFFLLIFCPDSKFLYLAYIYDIKDILFLLVPPQNLCVFSYIYRKNTIFLCILPRIIYIAIFLYIYIYLCFHQTSSFLIYNKHSFFFLRPCPDQFLVHIFIIYIDHSFFLQSLPSIYPI